MAIQYGNRITDDSIVFHVDFANRRSFAPNMLNYSHWTVGSGGVAADGTRYGVTNYNANGDAGENVKVLGTDPFGYANSVVWKSSTVDTTLPTGDGGWNTGYFAIDNSKMYRFSVWTRRDEMTVGPTNSGSFYIGHRTSPDLVAVTFSVNKTNGTLGANTYFHVTPNPDTSTLSSVAPPSLGGLNVWTLVVGHVWPVSTPVAATLPGTNINGLALNGSHPDSGVWTASGKVGNLNGSGDWIWYPTAMYANHRAYLYYSADLTATQSFIYPRVDVVDGLEPTIKDLLRGPEPVRDLSPSKNVLYPLSTTNFDPQGRGMVFSATESNVIAGTMSPTFNASSVSVWFNPSINYGSGTTGGNLIQFGPPSSAEYFLFGLGEFTSNLTNEVVTVVAKTPAGAARFTAYASTTFQFLANTWNNVAISWNGAKYLMYINGQEVVTSSFNGDATLASNVNFVSLAARAYVPNPYGAFFQGKIGSVVIYNRQLTPDEILTDYNSMLRKYGAN